MQYDLKNGIFYRFEKEKKMKKIISVLCVLALALCGFCVSAFAEEPDLKAECNVILLAENSGVARSEEQVKKYQIAYECKYADINLGTAYVDINVLFWPERGYSEIEVVAVHGISSLGYTCYPTTSLSNNNRTLTVKGDIYTTDGRLAYHSAPVVVTSTSTGELNFS